MHSITLLSEAHEETISGGFFNNTQFYILSSGSGNSGNTAPVNVAGNGGLFGVNVLGGFQKFKFA
jgi:hypothetical protein